MKNAISIYSKISIAIGVILISLPISYLSVNLFNKQQKSNTVYAQAEIESEIISQSLISNDKSLEAFSGTSFEIQKYFKPVVVPTDSVANYGYTIEIPSVGISTTIYESQNSDLGLKAGVWRIPDFSEPFDASKPMVLAAHRWGDDSNSWEYRAKNLFLNLPDVKNGDKITITWTSGEVYEYVVNLVEENEYVTKFDDLIMYTCKDYSSDVRFFTYATRVR